MLMEDNFLVAIILGLFGLVMGSFAGAMVWRIRAAQLRNDAAAGDKISGKEKKEVSHLKDYRLSEDRSVCLHCGHQLAWYDLLPLVSWVSLRGNCRYCRKPIGYVEPLIEIGVAAFFVISYLTWPAPLTDGFELARFLLWLIGGVGLAILFAYDARWYLLPNRIVFPLIGLGILNAVIILIQNKFAFGTLMNIIDACLILSGLYYVIYTLSRHAWVGFGDVKLGLALALLLADWQLALLALFLANAVGTLVILPLMIAGKVDRGTHVPFGPLLIVGFVLAGLFGHSLIGWYLRLILGA